MSWSKAHTSKEHVRNVPHLGAIRFDTRSKNFVWYFSKKDQMQMSFEKKSPPGGKDARLSNALIGQQDMSKFYKSTTSQSIFGLVNKLCEIGLPMEVYLIMINIVLFSSDNITLEKPAAVEAAQTYCFFYTGEFLIFPYKTLVLPHNK